MVKISELFDGAGVGKYTRSEPSFVSEYDRIAIRLFQSSSPSWIGLCTLSRRLPFLKSGTTDR